MPKANRRIGELKRDIAALGTPNIGAIDEFQRVNTRYTYLTDQRNDVEKAKGELENIIGEITEEMTKIFAEQFKLLSESFQTTFQELFGEVRPDWSWRTRRTSWAAALRSRPSRRERPSRPSPCCPAARRPLWPSPCISPF